MLRARRREGRDGAKVEDYWATVAETEGDHGPIGAGRASALVSGPVSEVLTHHATSSQEVS